MLVIDIPERTVAHIRSNYGHGYRRFLSNADEDIVMSAIYRAPSLSDILDKITDEIQEEIHDSWSRESDGMYAAIRIINRYKKGDFEK